MAGLHRRDERLKSVQNGAPHWPFQTSWRCLAERGISVDHTTIHRRTVRYAPLLLERFNRRKRSVTGRWHIDETYIKVRGQWMYLYRAIDSVGDTVEFWFSDQRDLPAARPTARPSFPVTPQIDCRIALGVG